MNPQFWWYVARASGIVSWALLAASVVWGVTLAARLLGTRAAPAWLLDLHRWLGALSVVFVGVHLAGLVADNYTHFGVSELFVPMASAWRPGAVAWGVVAVYLLVAVEVTSLLKRKLPRTLWRRTHHLSFPLYVLATIHLFAAGTDASNAGLLATAASVSGVVFFSTLVRVLSPRGEVRRPAVAAVARAVPEGAGAAPTDRAARLAALEARRAAATGRRASA